MEVKNLDSPPPFEALFKYVAEGIIVSDQVGTMVLVNPAAEAMFGYVAAELMGQKVEMLIPASRRPVHAQHREQYQQNLHSRAMGIGLDLYAQRKDGSVFPVEISLSPYESEGQRFVIAFVIDITVRQRLIAAREEALVALEKEKEVGVLKSRFVSIASHEFRNPLSAILSSASLIASYVERQDMDGIRRHVARIKGSVGVLQTILGDFLSLGRIEDGKVAVHREAIDLPKFMAEVQEDLHLLLKPGQALRCDYEGKAEIWLDKNLLRVVVVNLMSNAVKFSPENTSIHLHCSVGPDACCISVRDQGMGIPEADHSKLFGRFFRASNASQTQGTGLGLYIVKKYVELMGGTLTFESQVGVGTTFDIVFQGVGGG
jgi:PAS domain S-box-containing protein